VQLNRTAPIGQLGGIEDRWEWDGSAWIERTPAGRKPPARCKHALAYDSARGRLVLFGGFGVSGEPLQDTWEWDLPLSLQPATHFAASLVAAGLDPSAVAGLRVRGHCGGRFSPFSDADTGAVLLGWATGGERLPHGSWVELASNGAGHAGEPPYLPDQAASLLDWTAATADEAQRFVVERDRQLSFQCRPAGGSGSGLASVALDYIEVRVRYSVP